MPSGPASLRRRYLSKGFIEDIRHDLEKIFHPVSYKIGESLTEPPIHVPNTGFNSLYATIANVKARYRAIACRGESSMRLREAELAAPGRDAGSRKAAVLA